jgi:hypothetical protein
MTQILLDTRSGHHSRSTLVADFQQNKLKIRSFIALTAFLLPGTFGCSSHSDLLQPGVSEQARSVPDHGHTHPAKPGVWEHKQKLPTLVAVEERALPSEGHNPPYWRGQVKVSPQFADAYRSFSQSTQVPVGTIVLEEHKTMEGNSTSKFVMVKREKGFSRSDDDWEFLILSAENQLVERGHLPLCARCHADSPYHTLFGPPASVRRSGAITNSPLLASDKTEKGHSTELDEAKAPAEDALPLSKEKGKPSKKRKRRRKLGKKRRKWEVEERKSRKLAEGDSGICR